jgi:hypothetical protein
MGDGTYCRKEVRHIRFARIVLLRTDAALSDELAGGVDVRLLFTCFRVPAPFPFCKRRRPDL